MKCFFCSVRKNLVLSALLIFSCYANAQNNTVIKYYDASWRNVPMDSAEYYTEFKKINDYYDCTSYFLKSKKLKSISTFTDTLFTKQIGLLKRYYESGVLEDSVLVLEKNNDVINFHYYPNGKLWAYRYFDARTKKSKVKGYDEKGNEIEEFIFEREASYPDGDKAWIAYLSENINTQAPVKNKAPAGSYTVIVNFVVDVNGKLKEIAPETNAGFGTEQELMRVIRKSGKWIPAVLYGVPVNAYRRQPMTFVVK